MSESLHRIHQCAKAYQYQLHPRAVKSLIDYLKSFSETSSEQATILTEIFSYLSEVNVQNRFVSLENLQQAISEVASRRKLDTDNQELLKVRIASLENCLGCYIDPDKNEVEWSRQYKIENRLDALQQRYLFVRRRCLSSGIFRWSAHRQTFNEHTECLLPIISLEGQDNKQTLSIIGVLVPRKGEVWLEDLHGAVKLDLEDLNKQTICNYSYFITFYLYVIVNGIWNGNIFRVKQIILPPAEARQHVLFNETEEKDYLQVSAKEAERLKVLLNESANTVICFLANIFLDCTSTFKHLTDFFKKIEQRSKAELVSTTFVFIGNFSSSPLRFGDALHLQNSLTDEEEEFIQLLEEFARYVEFNAPTAAEVSEFVFVPGPEDLSLLQGVFPQPYFPTKYQKVINRHLKHTQYAYNPCHLSIGTQEIVVCRRNFERSFRQSELNFCEHAFPFSDKQELSTFVSHTELEIPCVNSFQKIAKTILDEAHLLPEVNSKIVWSQDETMRLTVLPHLLVLCDLTEQWECNYRGVRVINPGSFTVSATFLWYTPADNECVLSSLY